MRKILLITLPFLTTVLFASDIIVKGKVEVASIVGFDMSDVTSTPYTTGTNTFLDGEISAIANLNEKFHIKQTIYVKSNSASGLEMSLSAPDGYGDLKNGRYTINVNYKLMDSSITMDGSDWKTIPTTTNTVTTLTDKFEVIQINNTTSDQVAGTYKATITATIRPL